MSKDASLIIELLNQALNIEYSLIVHIPRIASLIEDEETRELVLKLGNDSIKHADVVAHAIENLGGIPAWSFESFPAETDIVTIFQKQVDTHWHSQWHFTVQASLDLNPGAIAISHTQ